MTCLPIVRRQLALYTRPLTVATGGGNEEAPTALDRLPGTASVGVVARASVRLRRNNSSGRSRLRRFGNSIAHMLASLVARAQSDRVQRNLTVVSLNLDENRLVVPRAT